MLDNYYNTIVEIYQYRIRQKYKWQNIWQGNRFTSKIYMFSLLNYNVQKINVWCHKNKKKIQVKVQQRGKNNATSIYILVTL